MIEPELLKTRLQAAFPDARMELEDLTGTKDHYQLAIASEQFVGKTPIEQHQLVYRALAEEMKGPVHALALKTFTPESWNRTKEAKTS